MTGHSLAGKVAFLSRPESYPQPCGRVERIETHFSWVFLTERSAYKLKKPVHEALVDLQTASARRRNCEEEMRINRRFAGAVYEAVVALRAGRDGSYRLDGDGQAVDWLVRMRRLSAHRMLDQVIARGELDDAALAPLVALLCRVYAGARVPLTADAYRTRLAAAVDANERELSRREFALPQAGVRAVCAAQRALLENSALFADRVAGGHIVEGHGDLRPEHVCLEDPPVVIDSLEFSRDLRIADTVDELGFLALECERLGAPGARRVLLTEYARITGDRAPDALVHFYQSLRACVRAWLAIRHVADPAVRDHGRWTAAAGRYLDLAQSHAGLAAPVAAT